MDWRIKEVQMLKKMRKDGRTLKEVAEALGRTLSSVTSYTCFIGLNSHKKMNEAQKKEAIKMYLAGEKIQVIANKFGYTRESISQLMIRTGHKRKLKTMTLKEAVSILEAHQNWRRDNSWPSTYEPTDPTQLGIAIDRIIEAYKAKAKSLNKSRAKNGQVRRKTV